MKQRARASRIFAASADTSDESNANRALGISPHSLRNVSSSLTLLMSSSDFGCLFVDEVLAVFVVLLESLSASFWVLGSSSLGQPAARTVAPMRTSRMRVFINLLFRGST